MKMSNVSDVSIKMHDLRSAPLQIAARCGKTREYAPRLLGARGEGLAHQRGSLRAQPWREPVWIGNPAVRLPLTPQLCEQIVGRLDVAKGHQELAQLALLVDRGLPVGADADVECDPLRLAHDVVLRRKQSTGWPYRYQVY